MAEHTVEAYAHESAQPVTEMTARSRALDAVRGHTEPLPTAMAEAAGAAAVDVAEVGRRLKRVAPGKAPRPDGLPGEVRNWCRAEMAPLLAALFSSIGRTGQLPPGFHDGAVTSCYKGAGDRHTVASYQPIALLNSNNRVLGKVLAACWGLALDKLVGQEQTAFLPGRHIGDLALLL